MMRATIKIRIISYVIAMTICFGLIWFFSRETTSGTGSMQLPDKTRKASRTVGRKVKEEQSKRPLPADYSRKLVVQSEVLTKKELETRLNRFLEMSEKMRQRKDSLLSKIETRKLPRSAPDNANDVSMARNISQASNSPLQEHPSIEDLYNMLRQYETEIQNNNLAVNAAELTLRKGLSFPDVYNSMRLGMSNMPSFEELILYQTGGKEWQRSSWSNASAGLYISSTADLNNYRGLLGQATRQAGLAGARLESLFGIPRPGGKPFPGGNNYSGGSGNGSGDGGMAINYSNTGKKAPMRYYAGARLDQDMVKAQALPGRRFSKDAARKGWLYINTWYIIGPWDNFGRDDFALLHPPENSIDLDAVYTDGLTGTGIAETDADPLQIVGEEVSLDGTLRWKFMQSDSMHNTVPVTTDRSTYYAYTELYFDEASTMLVAIGTDDSGRIWINGKEVWQDTGTSWYHIDENIVLFQFQQGWNRVLLRLENSGGGPAGFSFLICPREAVNNSAIDKIS